MCVFCDIVRGETPAHVVFEDDLTLAFLDVRPVFEGHTLLVPKEHHETLGELPDALIAPLFTNARTLSLAVVAAMDAVGTFVAMNNKVSQSVPHLHVHVVPRRPKDGLRGFFWPRRKYRDEDEMKSVAGAIRAAVGASE
ncbi:MAG TPA: HIT family protein [Actinomycetota bacterium]|nr:HIT family protein [Actinomycetota bacterium]